MHDPDPTGREAKGLLSEGRKPRLGGEGGVCERGRRVHESRATTAGRHVRGTPTLRRLAIRSFIKPCRRISARTARASLVGTCQDRPDATRRDELCVRWHEPPDELDTYVHIQRRNGRQWRPFPLPQRSPRSSRSLRIPCCGSRSMHVCRHPRSERRMSMCYNRLLVNDVPARTWLDCEIFSRLSPQFAYPVTKYWHTRCPYSLKGPEPARAVVLGTSGRSHTGVTERVGQTEGSVWKESRSSGGRPDPCCSCS